MNEEGPTLETLTHRLAECPGEFLAEPRSNGKGAISVAAVVSDLLRFMGGAMLNDSGAIAFTLRAPQHTENYLHTVLVASWLLHDPWFAGKASLVGSAITLLFTELVGFASVVKAADCVTDPDRREELVRFCLKHLDLRPRGESANEAEDRLAALDSAERIRVAQESRKAEERARSIRDAMAKRAAEEAAAKYGRE